MGFLLRSTEKKVVGFDGKLWLFAATLDNRHDQPLKWHRSQSHCASMAIADLRGSCGQAAPDRNQRASSRLLALGKVTIKALYRQCRETVMDIEAIEVTGRWEELVSRPEFRGHRVRITVLDRPSAALETDDWVESLRRMASNGVRIIRPADDSRESIY
jgi:hypothetical protein